MLHNFVVSPPSSSLPPSSSRWESGIYSPLKANLLPHWLFQVSAHQSSISLFYIYPTLSSSFFYKLVQIPPGLKKKKKLFSDSVSQSCEYSVSSCLLNCKPLKSLAYTHCLCIRGTPFSLIHWQYLSGSH